MSYEGGRQGSEAGEWGRAARRGEAEQNSEAGGSRAEQRGGREPSRAARRYRAVHINLLARGNAVNSEGRRQRSEVGGVR